KDVAKINKSHSLELHGSWRAAMMLRDELCGRLLKDRGIFVTECCDKCGQLLGAVRFTRKNSRGEWCSRKCRDRADTYEPDTRRHCKARLPEYKRRGSAFCDDACRKAFRRSRTPKLSRTKPSLYAGFSSGKEAVGISGHPGTFGGPGR